MSRLFVDYGWSLLPAWFQIGLAAYSVVNNAHTIRRTYETVAFLTQRVRSREVPPASMGAKDWVWVSSQSEDTLNLK
jgi:hypothetical protein